MIPVETIKRVVAERDIREIVLVGDAPRVRIGDVRVRRFRLDRDFPMVDLVVLGEPLGSCDETLDFIRRAHRRAGLLLGWVHPNDAPRDDGLLLRSWLRCAGWALERHDDDTFLAEALP